MNKDQLLSLLEEFHGVNVLVVGDVMLDSYWWGNVNRISPEAPVPVVSVNKTESRPGGAANVALNIRAMGANPFVCSVIGDDEAGRDLREILNESEINSFGLLEAGKRKTTVKTRVIGNNHQLLRVDHETEEPLDEYLEKKLVDRAIEILEKESIGVVIFQDYDKGVLSPFVIEEITKAARAGNVPVAVDPKRKNFLHYKKCTLFKPNLKELSEGLKLEIDRQDDTSVVAAACEIREKLEAEIVLLTLSERGSMYCDSEGSRFYPAHIRNIADVSGAGDSVISVAALCLALGTNPQDLTWLSNLAGGLVCEQVGVVPVDKESLQKEAINLIPAS